MVSSSHIFILAIFVSHVYCTSYKQCGEESGHINYHCPKMISRSEWKAREPKEFQPFKGELLKYVVVHHSATPECSSKISCISRVQNIQNYHMDGRNYSDIAYNYLISGYGMIFVGRGSEVQGAHAKYYNNVAIGICLIGDFTTKTPSMEALTSLRHTLFYIRDKFDINFELKGHRDLGQTKCPGHALYEAIRYCPFYKGSSKSPSTSPTTTASTPPSSTPSSTPSRTSPRRWSNIPSSKPSRIPSSRSSGTLARIFASRYDILISVFLVGHRLVQNLLY